AVGASGTIVMSTLTGWSEPFDASGTPSAVGKISETFRLRSDAVRSLHPVHSVAAVGKHARDITSGHEKCETGCGAGTPYMKIHDLGGKVMLLGVDMDRNTIMHSLEEAIDSVYLKTLDIPAPNYLDAERGHQFTLKKFPPGHRDFIGLTPVLRERDAIIEGRIGDAVVRVMEMRKFFSIGLEALKENPMLFICHNPNCNFCHWAGLIYEGKAIDYSRYRGTGCVDETCEICVVE
ncbi:MAG: AAC(3) family N-acetyltransferase, partial [Clostridia bacterium]|nr:AAC(3) family N-acetyltransferase [Clostridia bacterium]